MVFDFNVRFQTKQLKHNWDRIVSNKKAETQMGWLNKYTFKHKWDILKQTRVRLL